MPFSPLHENLVKLAVFAIESFFHEIKVVGEGHFPPDGPLIVASSHFNMAIDPACLSRSIPRTFIDKRFVHYWVKDALFKNPAVGWILTTAGNIPVDRKNKDNQKLYRGTFEVLAIDEMVAIFPEGTSHNLSRLSPLKDGASWTALEYLKYIEDNQGTFIEKKIHPRPSRILPMGITYTNKTKYRSSAIVQFGAPFGVEQYKDEMLSGDSVRAKAAVKKITAQLTAELEKLTVNAPDWVTLDVAKTASELLWEKEGDLALENYVKVQQILIAVFSSPMSPEMLALKETLANYSDLLGASRLTNFALAHIPLPRELDPSRPTPLPSRLTTLSTLVRDFLGSFIRLPFFALPFLLNIPIYLFANWGAQLALADEEVETVAQMKVFFGLALALLLYPFLAFVLLLTLVFWWKFGLVLALVVTGVSVWGVLMYHRSSIDDNYERFRRLVAAFRILVGLWSPPEEDVVLPPRTHADGEPGVSRPMASYPAIRIPSRKLVRQVLRTRVQARLGLAKALHAMENGKSTINVAALNGPSTTTSEVAFYLKSVGAIFPIVKADEHWSTTLSESSTGEDKKLV